MNKEEADNLQNGQEIFVKAIFNDIGANDEIHCYTQETDSREWPIYADMKNVFTALPTANENATENKPKYNPCRLFKKGDKVRVVECKGRCPGFNKTTIYKVGENESESGRNIMLTQDGYIGHITVDAAYLELVTPVEELEPYKVWDTTFSFNVGVEDSKAVFYYGADMSTCPYTKEQAKAAAEAERDRLNAEWRKEQNND